MLILLTCWSVDDVVVLYGMLALTFGQVDGQVEGVDGVDATEVSGASNVTRDSSASLSAPPNNSAPPLPTKVKRAKYPDFFPPRRSLLRRFNGDGNGNRCISSFSTRTRSPRSGKRSTTRTRLR